MDFNAILDSDVIKNLKCTVCSNYLSYFPIHITTGGQNICGRCDIPKGSVCVRNEIYELVASELRFPCRYNSQKCIEKLHPVDIPSHEKECKLRVIKCPANEFGQCTDDIPLPDLKQHCEDKHGDVVLKNGEFQMDLSVSEEKGNILIHNDGFYIFERNFDSTNTKFSCVVYNFASKLTSVPKMYELSLNTNLRNVIIKGYIDEEKSQGDSNEVCLDILKTPSCSLVEGKISFEHKKEITEYPQSQGKILEQLRTALKCSACDKYVMPPIKFSLVQDKLLCSSCIPKYQVRFFELDKVTAELQYLCVNEKHGCDFVSKPSILKQHEVYCPYTKNTTCPLGVYQNCHWKGFLKDVSSHIYQAHAESIAKSSTISKNRRCKIIKFADILFRLSFIAVDNSFYWAVQMIGEYYDSFLFELEVGKLSKSEKLVTVQKVGPLTPVVDIFKDVTNCCYYKYDQIKNFVPESEILCYKINIFKK